MLSSLFPRTAGNSVFRRFPSTPGSHYPAVIMFPPSLFSSSSSFLLSTRSMDLSKFVLCFLILFNIPASDKGVGVLNNVASGTIISISTSKGSVIIAKEGGQPINISPAVNSPTNTNSRRWNHYETALSNTGPLLEGEEGGTTAATTVTTTPSTPPPTTTFPTTEDVEPSSVLDSSEVTKKPGRMSGNKTIHGNLLNSARKYIASYEDLQSRFPDGSPFENNTNINMTVPLGDTAFLRCRVRNLGERSISWIRRRDWHILTTGKTTYTNDERFNVLHVDGTEDWTLQIKFVQKRDNGTYECQVSTGTGIISYFVNLFIAVPEAFILGNGEYHVEQGSNINLVCVIEKSPKPPEFIFWYHNERMINYGNTREVVVRTEPGARTHSRLTIKDARIADSGNYTCKTAHAEPASIFVYVSQASGLFSGDKMAAIQRRKTTGATSSSPSESTAPVAASSAPPTAVLPLTAMTTLPTTTVLAIFFVTSGVGASLMISSIQLSSTLIGYYYFVARKKRSSYVEGNSNNSNVVVISTGNKINSTSYSYATGNFLLSVFYLISRVIARTVAQTILFFLLFPLVLIQSVGKEICSFIFVKVEPFIVPILLTSSSHPSATPAWWQWLRGKAEKEEIDDNPVTTHRTHYYHHLDYCLPANNHSCSSLQKFNIEQKKQSQIHHSQRYHQTTTKTKQQQIEQRKLLLKIEVEARKVQQQWGSKDQKELDNSNLQLLFLYCRQYSFQLQQDEHSSKDIVILARRKLLLSLHKLNRDLVSPLPTTSSSSFTLQSSTTMKKSLPVFPSIAQSVLWTPFSSEFSRFLQIVLELVIRRGILLLSCLEEEGKKEMKSRKERSQNQRPLFLFHPSNRLGFRTISHLLIFPTKGPLEQHHVQ